MTGSTTQNEIKTIWKRTETVLNVTERKKLEETEYTVEGREQIG